jgi:hypothetical protein
VQATIKATVAQTVKTTPSKEVPPANDENDDGVEWDRDDDLKIEVDEEKADATITKPVGEFADAAATKDETVPPPPPSIHTDAPSSTPASSTTPLSGAGGLFSNLSDLAKTADSFLTPTAVDADKKSEKEDNDTFFTPIADDSGKKQEINDAAPADTTTAQEESPEDVAPKDKLASPKPPAQAKPPTKPEVTTPKSEPSAPPTGITPKSKAAAPSPKFTPGGSLFSNLTNLAQTADSMLTAAVEESAGVGDAKIVESSEPLDSEGWDADGDDDAFLSDDEDADETQIEKSTTSPTHVPSTTVASKEKGKTEGSTSSFIKVSPTSSISTAEVLPAKVPIPQPKEMSKGSPPEAKVEVPLGRIPSAPTAAANIEDDPRFQKLQETLRLREEQLIDKGTQLNELQLLLESRDEQFKMKIHETKEEAKKRILRAKERCEVAEAKLSTRSAGDSEDLKKKQMIIDELLEEGQALAQKQSVMERSVRDANAQTRALKDEVQQEAQAKEQALNNIKELEARCKVLKDSLTSARKGESQAEKLENDLLSARADAEEKATTILSLQQRLKEMTAESKDLKREINETRKSAAHAAQQEQTSMRREHNDLIGDLEQKLRTTEREAGVREDALRHEISEIRKRWQDAVRRADALSMDIQSSTAPLLRQLESMERQSRLRASNAAELENRLRSNLEEATIENERLCKEFSELKSKLSKLERSIRDRDQELTKAQSTLEEQARDLNSLRSQEEKLLAEAEAKQVEYERVERLANEGVAKVRSEMSQTVMDSEERYRGQIDKLQKELVVEKEKRSQLETQVGQLLESGGGLFAATQQSSSSAAAAMEAPYSLGIKRESKPKKLHKAEGQAEILAGALGLDSSDSDADSDDDDDLFDRDEDGNGPESEHFSSGGGGGYHSFAAIEQLSSKLKTTEVELKSMRKSLKESNEIRQSLVEELGEARNAVEKLPLFEARVDELTKENKAMELEISGLKEDISDVRELYRTQLNVLLEEKTANISSGTESAAANETEPAQVPEQSHKKSDGNDGSFVNDW